MSDFELLSHNGGEPRERNPSASGAPSSAPAEQGNAEPAGCGEGHSGARELRLQSPNPTGTSVAPRDTVV